MTNKNRASWNKASDAYQEAHGRLLDEKPLAWGVWRIREADLDVLGVVKGRDVLELGRGAAQWTIALIQSGAQAVGIDLSERQLDHARDRFNASGMAMPLVHGDAQSLPFRDESFDIVFCDHGATVFTPPEVTIPVGRTDCSLFARRVRYETFAGVTRTIRSRHNSRGTILACTTRKTMTRFVISSPTAPGFAYSARMLLRWRISSSYNRRRMQAQPIPIL